MTGRVTASGGDFTGIRGRMTAMRAIGLMSGTSLDGVDVALVETDGEQKVELGRTGYRAYSDAERETLRGALADAAGLTDRAAPPGP
jgi:anhydro-N-acetylmuramic acid kinase